MSKAHDNIHRNIINNTIPKNTILNWLYATDHHVSIEKLGEWLEYNTNGQYKLVKTTRKLNFAEMTMSQK